jgi:serine/threonine-protein kinase
LWKRIFGVEEDDSVDAEAPAPAKAEPRAGEHEPGEPSPEQLLSALGRAPRKGAVDADLLDPFEKLVAEGREARALELARRALAHYPDMPSARLRVARLLTARGDDAGATLVLGPLVSVRTGNPATWMLAAEIAERRGDDVEALALYERVLADDLDYPQARERVARLREARDPRPELAGATLLTDGALARGRYRVSRELGRGGAGTVFAAHDQRLGRTIALKVYHRRGRAERERLLAEARTPALLEHPGVVRVLDLDVELAAIAMEWVRGGSVRAELGKGVVPIARARRWLATAVEALGFVHAAGYVHRDLKPSNFLLREDDRVVLTDFGLACRAGESPADAAGQGTLAYMAPEQRANAPARPAADVFAIGATMRELLGQSAGDVPGALVELSNACMRQRPEDRPTLQALRDALG